MRKLFYLPLEPYIERSSYFMSSPDGWFVKHAQNAGFSVSDGTLVYVPASVACQQSHSSTIRHGVVLDAAHRAAWAASQVEWLCLAIGRGEVTSEDAIFFEDFWHPGIEGVFYACALSGIHPTTGAFCFAQTLDEFDFITPLRSFVAPMEDGIAAGLDYIFFASEVIRGRAMARGWGEHKCKAVGLGFHSSRLLEQLVEKQLRLTEVEKNGRVLFSSRFDSSKNPDFFLAVVEAMPDVSFDVVKPRERLTTDEGVLAKVAALPNLRVIDTSKAKTDYYRTLFAASVQFNCAKQDWVSWTLIEACLAGCIPVYPCHRDFPFELIDFGGHTLYRNESVDSAVESIRWALAAAERISEQMDKAQKALVHRHDSAIPRMISWLSRNTENN